VAGWFGAEKGMTRQRDRDDITKDSIPCSAAQVCSRFPARRSAIPCFISAAIAGVRSQCKINDLIIRLFLVSQDLLLATVQRNIP
jgi:hypothetical protein